MIKFKNEKIYQLNIFVDIDVNSQTPAECHYFFYKAIYNYWLNYLEKQLKLNLIDLNPAIDMRDSDKVKISFSSLNKDLIEKIELFYEQDIDLIGRILPLLTIAIKDKYIFSHGDTELFCYEFLKKNMIKEKLTHQLHQKLCLDAFNEPNKPKI